jgi:uncharacterized delta-60 repeat protein
MKIFWGGGIRSLLSSACVKGTVAGIAPRCCSFCLREAAGISPAAVTVLVLFIGLIAFTGKAQTSFYTPGVLPNSEWGSVVNTNTGVVPDTNCPTIAGFTPNAPLWYTWTAPRNGEVELDTVGSVGTAVNANQTYTLTTVYTTNYIYITNAVYNGVTTNYILPPIVTSTNVTSLLEDVANPPVPVTNTAPLDTVLAVYTGSAITGLSQVAANDNLFPVNNSASLEDQENPINKVNGDVSQITLSDSGDYATFVGRDSEPVFDFIPPYYGPSHLRFNAVAGTTYYIAVDTKPNSASILSPNVGSYSSLLFELGPLPEENLPATGSVSLQWAYQSSGVFRFATEDFDEYSGLPLYQTAETESEPLDGNIIVAGGDNADSAAFTYYPFNAQGVLVTVTRVAGSSGRCTVDYSTVPGTNLAPWRVQLPPNELPGSPGLDYEPVHGTLVFDDYEMSKTILVPITGESSGTTLANVYFGITLSNAQVDPYESANISQPRVDPVFGTAMVKILNDEADPYGPDLIPEVVGTNLAIIATTNIPPTYTTNSFPVTNIVDALAPTNAIFGFEKANYRLPVDVTSSNSQWTTVALYVERFGTNGAAETLNYRINSVMDDDLNGDDNQNIYYPLQPGSDFAGPTPAQWLPTYGSNSDFSLSAGPVASGTISFPATPAFGSDLQEIDFTITNSMLTRFNRDFKIDLYQEVSYNNTTIPVIPGMVAQTTVTVLFDDQRPPAGSVDELYNADFNNLLALPPQEIPSTIPLRDASPGVGSLQSGYVKSLVVLTNNETLIVGDFVSYNGFFFYNNNNPLNNIALVNTNGQLDQSFSPNSGADAPINSVVATTGNQYIIGGNFLSFNGQFQNYVARVNADGSLDTSFSPQINGPVNAVLLQPDGKVVIGGSFTQVNSQNLNGVARLNTNGTLDATFNPGTVLNGTVNALAMLPGTYVNAVSNGTTNENDMTVNVSPNAVGQATVKYNFPQNNEMRVFYGGNLIFDTGITRGNSQFSVPFGPGNAPLLLVVDPAGAQLATNWTYTATIATNSDIMAGGSFTVSGQSYANVARFTAGGILDTTFSNVLAGADNTVYALAWQANGNMVVGGAFANFNGLPQSGITCLNWDGSVNTNSFFISSGADDIVWSIQNQPDGTIYVGGQFSEINGTHRLGFARLYSNGTVDTTFMDTAYNQFAGLKKIFADDFEAVYTLGVESDSNVLIGGEFNQVGGGEASTNVSDSLDDEEGIPESFNDPNLWVEPKARDGVRNRGGLARLIGGSTPGPGNIQLQLPAYSGNKSQGSLTVGLVRTNGTLGPISANFSVTPGLAQSGSDYFYSSTPPLYWVASEFTSHPTRNRSDGLFGLNGALEDIYGHFLPLSDIQINNLSLTTVSIINNAQKSGNLNAGFQLANPSGADTFYLGGENIPLGAALGGSSAPFTVIDNTSQAGTFSFLSANFNATNTTAIIPVIRSNGLFGTVSMRCFATNGTALAGTDFRGVTNFSLQFGAGIASNAYSVTILANGLISTNFVEKTINLSLTSLSGGNAVFGISNAVLNLINPNFQGYLTLTATNYVGNENAGTMSFVVNRVSGSAGQITVQYATANGTAMNGVNYVGTTNQLTWSSGDSSSRTITIPVIDASLVGSSEYFNVRLFNPTNSAGLAPSLFYNGSPGSITNATMTITNNDSYGALQFTAPSYLVSEDGGYATITVVRSSGATGNVSVNYTATNALAGAAVNGKNFVATNGVLMFVTNQVAASFNVQILNDHVQDPTNLFFNVTLSNPVHASLGSPTNATVNILDVQAYAQPPGSTNGIFNANINGGVLALAFQTNGLIMAGGDFTSVDGTPQNHITLLNPDGSLNGSFGGSVSGPVQTIYCQADGNILIGGTFTTADGLFRNNIARMAPSGVLDTTFNAGSGANGTVYALAQTYLNNTNEIYVGGAFSTISSGPGNNTGSSQNFARLFSSGTLDTSFNTGSGADGTVYAIAVYPTNSLYAGDVLIAGAFVHYNGSPVNGIARLTSSGSLDPTFNPGMAATNGVVNSIAIQPDGRILVGGNFSSFNGTAAYNIIRINTDGSIDTSFTANLGSGANGSVSDVLLQPDNRILVVGQFTQFGGLLRNGVTRLLPSGAADYTINFGLGANGPISAGLVQASTGIITLGGSFSTYNGLPYNNIVQIYGLSTTSLGIFTFNAASYQVSETGIVAPITILRTGGTSGTNADGSGDVYLNFTTVSSNNTAVAGINYYDITTNLDFPPGQSYETVNVPILDDTDSTTNSWTVYMTLSSPTPPATLGGDYSDVPLTILNANSVVNFLTAFTNVSETVAGGIANIDVVRLGATNNTSYITFYTTTNGSTGIPGTDYYPTNETLQFNPGVTLAAAQVIIISNAIPEKTVGLYLTNPVDTLLFAPSNSLLAINNVNSPGELSFASANYNVNESSNVAVVTVQRQFGTFGNVFVTYSTVPGTAQPGINYTPEINQSLEIESGFSSGNINVPLLRNNPPQAPVSFSIVLSNATANATLIPPTNTTVTIYDDINTGVAFLNATNTFSETNGTILVPVERLGSTNSSFSIQFFTTNETALAGVNYVSNSGTLNFAAGQLLAGIPVTLLNDQDVTNVQFGVNLSTPSPNSIPLESPSNTVVVIQPAGAGLTFITSATNVFKNAGSITVPVVCLNPSAEPVIINSNTIPLSVNYSTVNGTAQAGVDYTAVSGTLIFTNGIATNAFTVPILNNSLITGLRTLGVSLSSPVPVPPARLISPSNEVITIIDSNSGLSFSTPNYSIFNGGEATITVLRTDNTNITSTVAFATVGGGTAAPGADYFPTNGILTFTNGQTSATFVVAVVSSTAAQPNKTVIMELSSPTNGVLVAPSAATLTIVNENGSFVVPAGVALVPGATPTNGILQPGQTNTLSFAFRDAGGTNIINLLATLLANNGVSSPTSPNGTPTQSYGPLTNGANSVSRQFTFTSVGTNSQTILATFALQDLVATGVTNNLGTNSFTLTIGTWSNTFSNTNLITFSLLPPANPPTIATPYPSIINVSNVGGVLVGATVTLTNFTATSPHALDILVVSPAQQDTLIMANVGTANAGQNNITLTFSDSALNYLPLVTETNSVVYPISSGPYKPTQYTPIPTSFP